MYQTSDPVSTPEFATSKVPPVGEEGEGGAVPFIP